MTRNSASRECILAHLRRAKAAGEPDVSTRDVAMATGLSMGTTRNHLARLEAEGLVLACDGGAAFLMGNPIYWSLK